MTVEHRLRVKVDKLTEERDNAVERVRVLEAQLGLTGFCPYCGTPIRGRVCSVHRDLLRVDAGMMR